MVQVVDYQEFLDLKRLVEQLRDENQFLKSLMMGRRWLRRSEALIALRCSDSTLRKLTEAKRIVYRKEGKTPFYDAFSIRDYLLSKMIATDQVDRQILSASHTEQSR